MFLQQERPKMDHFERWKNFGCKGKILQKVLENVFLPDTFAKILSIIFILSGGGRPTLPLSGRVR